METEERKRDSLNRQRRDRDDERLNLKETGRKDRDRITGRQRERVTDSKYRERRQRVTETDSHETQETERRGTWP